MMAGSKMDITNKTTELKSEQKETKLQINDNMKLDVHNNISKM